MYGSSAVFGERDAVGAKYFMSVERLPRGERGVVGKAYIRSHNPTNQESAKTNVYEQIKSAKVFETHTLQGKTNPRERAYDSKPPERDRMILCDNFSS